jgi:hypothetical protein
VHKVQHRTKKQQTTKIQRTKDTSETLGGVKNDVENDTTRGMASPLHSHFRGHTSELVYRLGIAQRNYNMDYIAT